MEVSGRKISVDKNKTQLCHICQTNDKQNKAFGHCHICNIHLCDTCVQTHTSERHSSFHTSVNANDPLPACAEHTHEKVKFFCGIHDVIGCIACTCMPLHKECQMDYIPSISEQFLKSKEFFHYKVVSEELKTRFAEELSKVSGNQRKVKEECERALQEIKEIKKEIIDFANDFENELEEKVLFFKNANTNQMKKIGSDLESLRKVTLKTETLIEQLEKENKHNAIFLEFKRAEKFIIDCQEKLYEISTRNSVDNLIFHSSTERKNFMCKEKLFGTIEELEPKTGSFNIPEILENRTVETVNIFSKDDKKSCYVSGLTFISNDHLAVADKANHKIKVVDVSKNKLVSEKRLTSGPDDITAILPDKIAVALGKEKNITILTNYSGLSETEKFRTNGKCKGISYDDGKLIVTYDNKTNPRIEILSLNGQVLCRFNAVESKSISSTGKETAAIDLSPDHQQMYITGINRAILRLSRSGLVTGSNNQHKYTGVAVSIGGSVYACSKEEDVVVQLSDDLSKCETVLTKTEGVKAPSAIAISKARNMLYVSCDSSDAASSSCLLVFKIKLDSDDAVLYSRQ